MYILREPRIFFGRKKRAGVNPIEFTPSAYLMIGSLVGDDP
jgi:hypothetical protein